MNHLKRKHVEVIEKEPPIKKLRLERDSKIEQYVSYNECRIEDSEILTDLDTSDLSGALTSTPRLETSAALNQSFESVSTSSLSPERSRSTSSTYPTIDKMFENVKSFTGGGSKATNMTNALLFMIAKANLPIQIVENEGLKYFVKIAAPLYKLPGRKSVTSMIEDKYELLSMNVKDKLMTVDAITLTSDIWTDTLNTRSYLGMTAHFICENKLKSVMLGVTSLEERHTAEYLGEWLLELCDQWKIKTEKIVAVVTDNGKNILKAVTDSFGKNKHLPCFAHTLNLVASGLIDKEPQINIMCEKVKQIVIFFKQSVTAADELRKATEKKLIQSVPTRWNSTYFMLDRFIEISQDVSSVLLNFPNSPPMLTANELQLAKETVQVLKPVETASRQVCGENYITASIVIPLINGLRKKIENKNLSTDSAKRLQQLLLINLNNRFGKVENVTLLAIATILDPRFKKLDFCDKRACSEAIQKIAKEMQHNSKELQKCPTENVRPLQKIITRVTVINH